MNVLIALIPMLLALVLFTLNGGLDTLDTIISRARRNAALRADGLSQHSPTNMH